MIDWASLKYFKPTERWGEPNRISPVLIDRLERWREYIGRPVVITCGTQGQHVADSEHYTGEAADVMVPGMHVLDQFFSAVRFGFSNIGVYPDWCLEKRATGGLHLGVRNNPFLREWLGVQVAGKQIYVELSFDNLKKYGVTA